MIKSASFWRGASDEKMKSAASLRNNQWYAFVNIGSSFQNQGTWTKITVISIGNQRKSCMA